MQCGLVLLLKHYGFTFIAENYNTFELLIAFSLMSPNSSTNNSERNSIIKNESIYESSHENKCSFFRETLLVKIAKKGDNSVSLKLSNEFC